MATDLFANQAATSVSSGGTDAPAAGTLETWTVASSAEFPTAVTGVSQFRIIDVNVTSEVMIVTNVSGTTWTVTRGAEGTATVSHTAGFTVQQIITAGVLNDFAQAENTNALAFHYAAIDNGYAAQTFDPWDVYSPITASLMQDGWLSGVVGLTKIDIPYGLPSLNGYMSYYYRSSGITSGSDAYIGLYTLAGGTLTLVATTADLSVTGGNQFTRFSVGVSSFPADSWSGYTPVTALYGAFLIGTQGTGSNYGGPYSNQYDSSIAGALFRAGNTYRMLREGSGYTALPSTIAFSEVSSVQYSFGWFAID